MRAVVAVRQASGQTLGRPSLAACRAGARVSVRVSKVAVARQPPSPPFAPFPSSHFIAPAWSWRVVRHRDSPALASLKLATAAALEELVPHSPRDLRLSPSALAKLKGAISPRCAEQLRG